MIKTKSLLNGIGNQNETERYYDDWAINYDQTLKNWNYKAPKKAADVLFNLKKNIIFNLDLACGTGLFAEELLKKNNQIIIDGCDISYLSLKIAKKKNLYRNLFKKSFEKKIKFNTRYESVSMIGSMTYCKKPELLFPIVSNYLKKNGIFIFTHRIDLWIKQDFNSLIKSCNKFFKLDYKSSPLNYLPENSDFTNKVKIRIVGLRKL
tara:strand:- start:732 stop:1352 length:621 start_codon:yes stop_codon:yes gene_type:complete